MTLQKKTISTIDLNSNKIEKTTLSATTKEEEKDLLPYMKILVNNGKIDVQTLTHQQYFSWACKTYKATEKSEANGIKHNYVKEFILASTSHNSLFVLSAEAGLKFLLEQWTQSLQNQSIEFKDGCVDSELLSATATNLANRLNS